MDTKLIGLSGRAGSGKSLVGDTLVANGYTRVKMAGALKAMLRALYAYQGMNLSDIERRLEGDRKERVDNHLSYQTPREAMQTLGTEWGRGQMHPDFWVNITAQRIFALMRGPQVGIVIDDVRFENEVDMIRNLGGKLFMVERKDPAREVSDHASEQYDFTPDGVIYNDGTKDDLVAQAHGIFLT